MFSCELHSGKGPVFSVPCAAKSRPNMRTEGTPNTRGVHAESLAAGAASAEDGVGRAGRRGASSNPKGAART